MRALLAFLLVASAGTAAAQSMTARETAYWDVVTRYATGNRKDAVATIGGWSEKDLDRILKSVQGLEKAARRCEACEDRARFDALPLRAAILLHAERDRMDRVARMQENGGAAECAISANGRMSADLLGPAALQPGGARFASRFYAVFAQHLRSALCFLTSRNWAEAGLKLAPRDAMLLFVDGLASETIGVTGFVEPTLRSERDWRGRQTAGYENLDPKREFSRAIDGFEKALAVDPHLSEARLRLGRVLSRMGRGPEARVSLKQAVEETSGASRYLAHLFLGQCLEDDGDLDGAIGQYSAAMALRPDSQIGAVALAHAHSLRGRSETAREVLEKMLPVAGRRQAADPYWSYAMGSPEDAEALIEDLRRETLR
ncbi:MAG: tetratricopeptide repeat protein [Vicinamibacteria bacterium]|nr:tetratricopeptide repeat protein [Vicinamibacteria bacterium]